MTDQPQTDYNEGDTVRYRGKAYTVGVDNGYSVHLPDLPDHLSYRDSSPRAGKFGGPPLYNRWVPKELLSDD